MLSIIIYNILNVITLQCRCIAAPGVKYFAQRHFSRWQTQSRRLLPFDVDCFWKVKVKSQTLSSICENSWSHAAMCAGTFVALSWPSYFDVRVSVRVCLCVRVDTVDRFISFCHVNRLTSHLGNNVWNDGCVHLFLCVIVCLFLLWHFWPNENIIVGVLAIFHCIKIAFYRRLGHPFCLCFVWMTLFHMCEYTTIGGCRPNSLEWGLRGSTSFLGCSIRLG